MRVHALLIPAVVLVTACNLERPPVTGPAGSVAQLIVAPDTVTLDPLQPYQFKVFGRTGEGDSVPVSVNWAASSGSIAESGLYTADSSESDAVITATLTASASGIAPLQGTSAVQKRRVIAITLTPKNATLRTGASLQFGATGIRNTGDTLVVSVSYAATGGTITTAGRYTAGSVPGTYRVIGTYGNGNSKLADTAAVAVMAIPVAGVTVTPAEVGVRVGEGSVQLAAAVVDSAGSPLTGRTVSWTSSASGVASVSTSGLVTGLTVGTATITATSEGKSGTATVTVTVAPVASVAVSPASASVLIGGTVPLTATPKDSAGNALSGRVVTWTSSAPAVATISASGLVTGVSAGSATFTASSEGKSGTATVTVSPVPVASVTVSPASPSVLIGQTAQLSATPKDANGNPLTGRVVTWTTSAPAVATVSASGLVTGVAPGSATITATSEGKSGSAALTVSSVPVATVTVSPASASIRVGATAQLTATTKDSAGGVLTGRTVTWSTSAAAVATVSASGLVTGVAAGTATITATSEGKSGASAITVTVVPVASVTIAPASVSLFVSKTAQLTVTTKDSAGNVLTGRAVTWASGNTTVATVSAAGLVTAKAAGSATITATSEGKSGTAATTVLNVPVATVTVSPATGSVGVGGTVQLAASTKDSAGNVLTGRAVTWTSSSTTVATVNGAGLVTGLLAGTATITATSEGKSGTAAVTVTTSGSGTHTGYYVTTTGSSGNDGSAARPWDLRTAMSGAGGRIRPGDTVWVRGGTYVGTFTGSLVGTSAAPIVMRAYPGERAILDGNGSALEGFTVDGSWAIYWGLEIMNSSTARSSDVLGLRPTGVYVRNAANVKLVNLIVHDTGHGTYTEYGAQNIEIYGWIIFNGGHQGSSRSDGHGIYIKNNTPGVKVARDNIIFNQFGFGIHGYSESSGTLKNLTFEGNVLFNNGELSTDDNPNLQVGGNLVADNDVVADNMLYFSPGHGFWNIRMGYNSLLNGTTVVRNNYIAGGGEMAEVGYWQNLSWIGNTFVGDGTMIRMNDPSATGETWSGNMHYRDPAARAWLFKGTSSTFAGWQQATGVAATDQAFAGKPTAPRVFVRPNLYEPGRATVVIYNWSRQASVSVDLSAVVPAGWLYEIRNVQQIFGAPVASGTYGGGALSFPMAGVTAQAPIGGSPNAPLVTGPDFNVFVVTSRAP
jgi:uncharacterized protein YjdB